MHSLGVFCCAKILTNEVIEMKKVLHNIKVFLSDLHREFDNVDVTGMMKEAF